VLPDHFLVPRDARLVLAVGRAAEGQSVIGRALDALPGSLFAVPGEGVPLVVADLLLAVPQSLDITVQHGAAFDDALVDPDGVEVLLEFEKAVCELLGLPKVAFLKPIGCQLIEFLSLGEVR
jgi:hypothetical protein